MKQATGIAIVEGGDPTLSFGFPYGHTDHTLVTWHLLNIVER